MIPPKLYARLSNVDTVVCSACWFTLAKVERDYGEFDPRKPKTAMAVDAVDFPAGWMPEPGGVWRMSKRAYENIRASRGPRVRRAPNPDSPVILDPAGNTVPNTKRERGYRPDSHLNNTTITSFPVEAVCPRCKRLQVVDPEGFTQA